MKKSLTFSAALAALLASSTAMAQPAAPESPRGAPLTRAEAENRANAAFERMDINQDGQLSAADREARAQQRFDAIDADNSGELSLAELTAAREQRAAQRSERREARAEMRGQPRGERAEGQQPRSGARPMMHQHGEAMAEGPRANNMQGRREGRRGEMRGRMLGRADADNNGAISKEEFTLAALARFDRADANSDGTISADERRPARGEGRMNRRQRG